MKRGDIIKRGATPMFAMVHACPCSGGVKLRMISTSGGPYMYRNTEVYSVDLLAHFGWRVVGSIKS